MANETILAAIKTGMKGELDSVTTYEEAAAKASGEVREFLEELAAEEKKHYNWLLDYYREISEGRVPEEDFIEEAALKGRKKPIVSEEFVKRIGASRGLSAAISAAILLETNGIRFYRMCAEETVSPSLKSFFDKLAEWEDKHYHDLLKIQEASERWFWDANRFEPF
jgi:rubrerythrin